MEERGAVVVSLSDEQRNFLTRVRAFIPLAEAAGVPGAVMMAQAAIESGWGRSGLARDGNAYFGVKARPGWHGAVYCGTTREWTGREYLTVPGTGRIYASYDDAIAAGCSPAAVFRAYDTLEANVRDYLAFYNSNPRYRRALDTYALSRDPRRFAVEIAAAGYATSPVYAHTLLTFMERCLAELLPSTITVRWNGVTITGEGVRLEAGRVFVRLRRLAEALGMAVRYDPPSKTVYIEEGRR